METFPLPGSALANFYQNVARSIHITELCQSFVGPFCLRSQGKTLRALFPAATNSVNTNNSTRCLKAADSTTNMHRHEHPIFYQNSTPQKTS
jgi:hypothetical protein